MFEVFIKGKFTIFIEPLLFACIYKALMHKIISFYLLSKPVEQLFKPTSQIRKLRFKKIKRLAQHRAAGEHRPRRHSHRGPSQSLLGLLPPAQDLTICHPWWTTASHPRQEKKRGGKGGRLSPAGGSQEIPRDTRPTPLPSARM